MSRREQGEIDPGEAIHYEIRVSLGNYVRYVELVTYQGDGAAIRRAITGCALQLLRHGANDTPPPSSPQWEGEVVYRVAERNHVPDLSKGTD